jgi:NodT family efflux transporter outer membrane factor (OMF) lipoprotein
MKRPLTTVISCVTASLLATSCMTLGPDYTEPAAPLETNWLEYEDPRISNAAPVEGEWWTLAFNDPTLVQLVDTALAENLTLRSAGLRVLQARQQLAIAIGNQYPQQQDVTGSAGKDRRNDVTDEIYDLGFNVSWEADVWGRFRRQIESASAVLDASVAGYDGVLISLVADVAETYLLIRTTQQRLLVAQHNVGLQRESVRISQAKFDAGEVSSLDVEQASTLLYNTIASVADLELSLQQLKNSLAILLGRPPQDLSGLLGAAQPVPEVVPEIAVGMPQDLIRRRPDIRVAERQLAAQSALAQVRTSTTCSPMTPSAGACRVDFSGTSSTTGASGATLDCRTRFFSSCWKTTARPCCRRRPTSRIPSSPT